MMWRKFVFVAEICRRVGDYTGAHEADHCICHYMNGGAVLGSRNEGDTVFNNNIASLKRLELADGRHGLKQQFWARERSCCLARETQHIQSTLDDQLTLACAMSMVQLPSKDSYLLACLQYAAVLVVCLAWQYM